MGQPDGFRDEPGPGPQPEEGGRPRRGGDVPTGPAPRPRRDRRAERLAQRRARSHRASPALRAGPLARGRVPIGDVRAILPPITFVDTEAHMDAIPGLGAHTESIL